MADCVESESIKSQMKILMSNNKFCVGLDE